MSRCTTTHGSFRCMKQANHEGNCEQLDRSGILTSSGRQLDKVGLEFNVRRNGDTDQVYRARIWSAAQ